MRAVIQRVDQAAVKIAGEVTGAVGTGLLVFLGIEETDGLSDIEWLCGKIARIRVMPDDQGVMNRSVIETEGEILVVSQFTLFASTRKGNRPSWIRAARPETAIPLYEKFIECLERESGRPVVTGKFGAMMEISLINNGPVTILIDTKDKE